MHQLLTGLLYLCVEYDRIKCRFEERRQIVECVAGEKDCLPRLLSISSILGMNPDKSYDRGLGDMATTLAHDPNSWEFIDERF